jgi:hypothetical protein
LLESKKEAGQNARLFALSGKKGFVIPTEVRIHAFPHIVRTEPGSRLVSE